MTDGSGRRRARGYALQMLCWWERAPLPSASLVEEFWRTVMKGEERSIFADGLFTDCVKHDGRITEVVTGASAHWRTDRMGIVDRNILKLATCELLYRDEIPAKVTINEGVELAKRFGSQESFGFVNGVLDRIARDHGGLGEHDV